MNYTIRELHGCRVIIGPVPITDLVALTAAWDQSHGGETDPAQQWIFAADVSQAMGATLVCGPREAMDQLRASLGLPPGGEPVSLEE